VGRREAADVDPADADPVGQRRRGAGERDPEECARDRDDERAEE
jgi:hypothetical protein